MEFVDICPHCEEENVFDWDPQKQGFIVKCKYCEREMMLCDACGELDEDGYWISDYCDWHIEGGYSVCHKGKYKED